MKKILLGLFILTCTTPGNAMRSSSFTQGEQLFHDTTLGTTGNSCASCHPDGTKLEATRDYDDVMLKEMINFCIRDALKGEMLDEKSTELDSLLLYLRSLEE